MKEPMPCKYMFPLLILLVMGIVFLKNEEYVIGMALFVVVMLASVIIGESQFWVKKEPEKEKLYPESSYKDYVILCKRNERDVLSINEWFKYVNLPINAEEI
jgi:membrane-bound ClpP family serine protease